MTITRFDGTTLPAGWTATEPALGHVVVSGGFLRLQSDAGATFNNLSGGITAPQGPLVRIPVSGAFDFAVGLGNAANAAEFQSFELTAWDQATTRGIRFAQYVQEVSNRDVSWFGRRQTATTANITLTAPPSNLYGPRGWMRFTWTGTQFILRSSMTGKPGSWHTHATVTDAFAPTEFLLGMTASTPDANGRELRYAVFVDMADQADDATSPPGETTSTPLHDFDLSGAALPAGLTSQVNAGGSVVVSGGFARLTNDTNVADSYAWLVGPTDLPRDHGMLIRYRFPQPSVQNTFGAPILRGAATTDLPGAQVLQDKYRPGTGTLAEINGAGSFGDIIRFLTANPTPVGENFDGSSEFLGFANMVENLDGEVNGNTGNWIWLRFEVIDGYWRARFWYDGSAEPSAWTYEGGDWTQHGTAWFLSWSHNDSTTGGAGGLASMDVAELELYEVVTSAGQDLQATITDTVGVTDHSVHHGALPRILNEPVPLSDTVETASTVMRSLLDTVNVADSVESGLTFDRVIVDALDVSDAAATTVSAGRSVVDSIGVLDEIQTADETLLTDSVGIADSVVYAFSYGRTVNDEISSQDVVTPSQALQRVVVDGTAIDDSVLSFLSSEESPGAGNFRAWLVGSAWSARMAT